jgi:hypothetical protein
MHATRLIFEAIKKDVPLPAAPVEGVCCVTGEVEPCVPRSELLGRSFTEQHLLKAPNSPHVGVAACVALQFPYERKSSWICDGVTFRRLTRTEVRPLVIVGVQAETWAGYITTSYKKHGALRAPVNSGSRQVWLFEMRPVDCTDRARVLDWWHTLNIALREGIGRQSMESLDMPPAVMRKVGIGKWESFRAWARDKYQSSLYALLCYLLPSQEELKQEKAWEESRELLST